MKFDLQWVIIWNDYGIVIVTINQIPSYKTNSDQTSSLKYNIFRNVENYKIIDLICQNFQIK
jgi:hypothetical protein